MVKNPRVNITFDRATVKVLVSLAKHESKSLSGLAKDLVLDALDRREDMVLSTIAEVRDIEHAKKIKHDDAWK